MSSFKSSENIQKKECGPDRSVSDIQFSSKIKIQNTCHMYMFPLYSFQIYSAIMECDNNKYM